MMSIMDNNLVDTMTTITSLLSLLSTPIILLAVNRVFSKRDKARDAVEKMHRESEERRDREVKEQRIIRQQESYYTMIMMSASLKLSQETARAVQREHPESNGSMTSALKHSELVNQDFQDFIHKQSSNYIHGQISA